jgi:hypothetical protein
VPAGGSSYVLVGQGGSVVTLMVGTTWKIRGGGYDAGQRLGDGRLIYGRKPHGSKPPQKHRQIQRDWVASDRTHSHGIPEHQNTVVFYKRFSCCTVAISAVDNSFIMKLNHNHTSAGCHKHASPGGQLHVHGARQLHSYG